MYSLKGKKYRLHTGARGGTFIEMKKGVRKYVSMQKNTKPMRGGAVTIDPIMHDIDVTSHQNIFIDLNGVHSTTTLSVFENPSNSSNTNKHTWCTYNNNEVDNNFLVDNLTCPVDAYSSFASIATQTTHDEVQVPLISKWNIEGKILVIGDVHGSKSALFNVFEQWSKLGYLNLATGVLQDGIFVISLGDLVDYGPFSMDVLYAMVKLRRINDGKVMLLKGNHEEYTESPLSGREAFDKQLTMSAGFATQIKTSLTQIGPSMLLLYLNNDTRPLCFMHGMYPVVPPDGSMARARASDNPPPITAAYIFPFKQKINIIKRDSPTITGAEDKAWASVDLHDYIQWNDISDKNPIYGNNNMSDMNTYVATRNNGSKQYTALGGDLLNIIIRYTGIKAFIRGHQDNCPTIVGPRYNPTVVNNTYPHVCYNTIATNALNDWERKTNMSMQQMKVCKSKTPIDSWCNATITVTEESTIWNRVVTTSMAFDKPMSDCVNGGFIVIDAVPSHVSTASGGKSKPRQRTKHTSLTAAPSRP